MGSIGKQVGGAIYVHIIALVRLNAEQQVMVDAAVAYTGDKISTDFNVVKLQLQRQRVSLLQYDAFFETPFPALLTSCLVDLATGTVTRRTYQHSENPPILHRKELLLPTDHPDYDRFVDLTQNVEKAGLFANSGRIGYRRQWMEIVANAGCRLEDHRLVKTGVRWHSEVAIQ